MNLEIDYEPVKWATPFHESHAEFPCLAGGLGSGKTYAALMELIFLALENPGFTYLIARKTMPSLRDTTFKTGRSLTGPSSSFAAWTIPKR